MTQSQEQKLRDSLPLQTSQAIRALCTGIYVGVWSPRRTKSFTNCSIVFLILLEKRDEIS